MRKIISFCIAAILVASISRAQSVPVKSVPVAEGDQFLLFPSERLAMGGASIALDDRLLDPFVNPAKAVNTGGLQFVSTPSYYGFLGGGTAGEGSGRTIPIGAVAHRNGFFGGAVVAYQELLSEQRSGSPLVDFVANTTVERQESGISQDNVYLFALGGAEIPGTGWSVGASFFGARLNGLEGVRRMYTSNVVRQDGGIQQVRLGFYRKWQHGDAAEVVLMHHRFKMDHQIKGGWPQTDRNEYDETRSFGWKAGYKYPLQSGWTLGGILVGDWKWHPKIPNYDLMQIPRDPGDSFAYNFGVGLSRSNGRATFAMDFIFEPIWSHTWANATSIIEGDIEPIRPGDKTVDNHFAFNNARIRMGIHQVGEDVDFSLGLDVHRISYELEQADFVRNTRRILDQSWTEWTVSTGFGKDFSGMRVQYMGRLTLGTGRPGVAGGFNFGDNFSSAAGDWVVAPSGPLALQEALAFSHQIALIVPLIE